ncbi:hypothetical protein K457DRAFT_125842 [Linnemannia elongata AG-77]|uniref:Uncharacterized protein n=1 Tax=Linnemannia elongata AG-77 TaxID=1314771 RepID=A0A197JYM5_9FUNG|nr:hypothetical protein K457DRAFT_125842 [Linnemannia elongata AG-77]
MKLWNLSILAAFLSLQAICRADCPEGRSGCLENCKDTCDGGWKDGASGCKLGCTSECNLRCLTPRGGCHKGYCWAGCASGVPFAFNEWCYTTRGRSQDYNYVSCSNDNECSMDWRCAGSCTV